MIRMKKTIIAIILFAISIGSFVFMALNIMNPEVEVNRGNFVGVYNVETRSYSGIIAGWSTSSGFGSMNEIVKYAENKRTVTIAVSGVSGGVFLLFGVLATTSAIRDKANKTGGNAR